MGTSDPSVQHFPLRPNHPDMAALGELLRSNDHQMEHGVGRFDQDQAFNDLAGSVIDVASLAYAATQRAMRAYGVVTVGDLIKHQDEVTKAASLWMDAFVAGALYERRNHE